MSDALPSLSVVIPSGDASRQENLDLLLEDIHSQSLEASEVEIVRSVSPNGKARNVGIDKTTGAVIAFLDDDVRLGGPATLEALVKALATRPDVGMVGTATQLPPGSSAFQQRCAAQIPRSTSCVLEELTDSDMVTTQCCAMRRETLERIGAFNAEIPRGVDPEMRDRVRAAGLRVAVAPGVWHYHPMPSTWRALLRMARRNGAASAASQRDNPEVCLYNPDGHVAEFEAQSAPWRRKLRASGRLLGALSHGRIYGAAWELTYAWGYLTGR